VDSRPNTERPSLASSEITRDLLVDKIYALLEEKIITGQLRPNFKFVEHEIAASLKVSRSPLREALLRLENSGFIIRNENGKRIVQSYTRLDAIELYQLWEMIEGFGARISSLNSKDQDIEKIEGVLSRMEKSLQDIDDYRELNVEFHTSITASCPNLRLNELHSKILKQIHWFTKMTLSDYMEPKISLREHRELFQLFSSRQADKLEQKVREHIQRAEKRLEKRDWEHLGKAAHGRK
jgi:DNA-binding GntR family transcriptional regulator